MNLTDIGNFVRTNAKEHLPLILSVAAGLGTISTAYLAADAGYKSAHLIEDVEEGEVNPDRKQRLIERTRLVWKLYIPTAISAVTTIACVAGSNRVSTNKTIAAQTAFAVSQRVYSEYRDKVIEEYGERKDQSIRDQIAEDRVKATAPDSGLVIAGSGAVLCCELFTGRYFNSDMETLRRAQNDLNKRLLTHDYATFDDFYYDVGLPRTSSSGQIGWKSSKLMEMVFSTVLTEDGRPCLAFEYNYTEPL